MALNNPNDTLDLTDQDLAELPPLPPTLKNYIVMVII